MQIQTVMGNVVELTPGTPTNFTATQNFQLPAPPGGIAPTIAAGNTMTFDGQNFSYGGNPPTPLPQFLGAIKAEWAVPTTSYTGQASGPRSAGIAVRPAEGGNPMDHKPKTMVATAQAEEQEVGNVTRHAAQVQQNNQGNYRRQAYEGQGTRGFAVTEAEDQEGIPVRQLSNPDGRKNPVDMSKSAAEAIRRAESTRVQPGQGRSREEIMAMMDPEQRAAYENEIMVRKAMHGQLDAKVAVASDQGQVVANLQPTGEPQEKEGIKTQLQVGGGTETYDAGGTGGEPEVSTVIVDGIKMTNTNGPKKHQNVDVVNKQAASPLDSDPRRVVAKAVCQDFPDNYDFDSSVRKKVARIQADYEDRLDIIRAVYAAENDEMKARLTEEFPEAFGG